MLGLGLEVKLRNLDKVYIITLALELVTCESWVSKLNWGLVLGFIKLAILSSSSFFDRWSHLISLRS